mmetsp:Transcript_14142/g.19701  ORF Transcript_14142/g.19701 Transcript_14142/m.19701 type:complete len:247 (-) Transcript_14142:1360-2100(-)|eukprot:CAMPEP_0168547794 /NCGR_PEP_ID=MMETSP0413-20121227/4223_1 /TAXON_ID=136452 /ORGANISM="Filamoeba nolandi, Strain NC-AS-23-1" /LENGTH=246 /DNA_ID=CAMNT_0008578065 /DNA_START=820 /DNA_END=1560 /DNA_ORIENTATION=-
MEQSNVLTSTTIISRPINDFIEVRLVPSKGRAVFSRVGIKKGEVFFVEQPILAHRIKAIKNEFWQFRFALTLMIRKWKGEDDVNKISSLHPMNINHKDVDETMTKIHFLEQAFVSGLGPDALANYKACNKREFAHVLAKIQLNSFKPNNTQYCCLYYNASLFNHSCTPNARFGYANEIPGVVSEGTTDITEEMKITVGFQAERDINEGEEITVCYDDDLLELSKENRKEAIRRLYLFDCTCDLCRE